MRWLFPLSAALVLGTPAPSGAQMPLTPPIPGPLIPTSSFGEYRAGHFHAGLDFSTGGREGIPVLAPQRGWVFRIRVSGIGYGRAIYFRLEDGRTVLYAHLSRFHSRMEDAVRATQDRTGRFEVELRPAADAFAFAAGDTLGFTGQSGAGPPHLHAELRVGEEAAVAVNPWLHGWAPVDSLAPILTRLRVEPARVGVLVNGAVGAAVVPLRGLVTPPEVRITGSVRLWVETVDPTPAGARLAPYRLEAAVDDRSIGQVVFDSVDWTWSREVGCTFDAARARSAGERWIALDPVPGARQEISRSDPDWGEDLDPGRYALEVAATDAAGNRTRAEVRLIREERDPDRPLEAVPRGPAFTSRGRILEIRVDAAEESSVLRALSPEGTRVELEAAKLSYRGGVLFQVERPRPETPGLWRFYSGDSLLGEAVWVPGAGGGLQLRQLLRSTWGQDEVTALAGDWRLTLPADGAYGPLWIAVRTGIAHPAGPGLEVVSPQLELSPWSWPLRRDLTVTWRPNLEDRRGLALARWEDGGWEWVDPDSGTAAVGGTAGLLETFAVVRDGAAPRITLEAPGPGRRPRLRATVRDAGVGVSWRELVLRVDGHPVIAEWDPDADRLLAHLREPLTPGNHTWSVEAVDRVGNRDRRSASFLVK